MAEKNRILIIAGEPSGDMHAGRLIAELKNLCPGITVEAVGGAGLRQAGAKILFDIREFSVIGIFDVIKKLPFFFALKDRLLKIITEDRISAVILVDFSGFNLRFARALNKKIPVIYYISPQVWASRSGRLETIRRFVDKLIVFFNFEVQWYKERGIEAALIGHPLLDIVRPTLTKDAFLKNYRLSPEVKTIALLPGSRNAEIKLILPVMLETARIMLNRFAGLQFIIAKTPCVDLSVYEDIIAVKKVRPVIIEAKAYDCMNAADYCLVASGTATLETAIMLKPMAVIYKMNPLNYLLYRPQVKVPYISLVNILAGKNIVPEFIQNEADPEKIAQAALKTIGNAQETEKIREELSSIVKSLGEKGAAGRGARIIQEALSL